MTAQSQLMLLRDRLRGPLPGMDAHERMMPSTRRTIYRDITIPDDAKKSAVLMLFYPDADGLHFPLIERTAYPGVHSKQIGLPGGAWEAGDPDYVATALRETEEEIGIGRDEIEVLGLLSSLYIPPSNFWVQPVVGFIQERPAFMPDPNEVEQVITAALSPLLSDNAAVESKVQHSSGMHLTVPSYIIGGHVVWGATAMMISEVAALLNRLH